MTPSAPACIHASCVLVGARAVLIRGPAGSGKSSLALTLLHDPAPFNFARLVSDDQVMLTPNGRHLIASAPPPLLGLIEQRGLGLSRVDAEAAADVALVVDIDAGEIQRLPDPAALDIAICGVTLARIALRRFDPLAPLAVTRALGVVYAGSKLSNAFYNEAIVARA